MTNEEIFRENMYVNPQQIDGAYINALVELVNACRAQGVSIDTVHHFHGGWRVTFEDFDGDAICHDHSYGSPYYLRFGRYGEAHDNDWSRSGAWETIDFPWDEDDVSVHSAEELAFYLHCYKIGVAPWEKCGEDEDY